ncbi:hypothetical protein FRC19_011192 [Serendipita sp. 401]|nr:hypothetical protein FRC19_011192 [Serendipita sp. 401]
MASTLNTVPFANLSGAMHQDRHSYGVVHQTGYPHQQIPQSHPAPPYEGIVDFTYSNVAPPQPYPTSSNLAIQQQGSLVHRHDATEWKQSSFYPYRPNEVKHRKRTTRQQLKVLEETFRTTQKPDGNVRKSLALQLDMTPRNVQVWFQNRRAKDKTLAKRALKQTDDKSKDADTETSEADATLDALNNLTSPIDSVTATSSAAVSPRLMHSGSSSPVEAVFRQQLDIAQPQPLSHVISPLTSPLRQEVFQSPTSYTDAPSGYSRDIYAPRGSLPHVQVSPYSQDLQHQRSNSSPAFLTNNNVDTTSTIPLNNYANIAGALYRQRLGSHQLYNQSLPSSVACVPSGPLPSSDFVFGAPHSSGGNESDKDKEFVSYGHYSQFSSMSGSDTPSSLSHYGSVASLADSDVASYCSRTYDDEMGNGPLGWQRDQRRGSNGFVTMNSRGISPVGHVNLSPRSGATPSSEVEAELPESALYVSTRTTWESTTSPESKPIIGYQPDVLLYQTGDHDSSEITPPGNAYQPAYMPSYDQNATMGVYNPEPSYGSYAPIPVGGYQFA